VNVYAGVAGLLLVAGFAGAAQPAKIRKAARTAAVPEYLAANSLICLNKKTPHSGVEEGLSLKIGTNDTNYPVRHSAKRLPDLFFLRSAGYIPDVDHTIINGGRGQGLDLAQIFCGKQQLNFHTYLHIPLGFQWSDRAAATILLNRRLPAPFYVITN